MRRSSDIWDLIEFVADRDNRAVDADQRRRLVGDAGLRSGAIARPGFAPPRKIARVRQDDSE
jgi:hypothetical protein